MTSLTPKEIVHELDRHIIGQSDAKKAVALALRNRWRRMQVAAPLRDEIVPKNILMIGPTGVGKTEIARRLAKFAKAPFLKVEATKFTEVGYVGRDVESIVRDLVDMAISMSRESKRNEVKARAECEAEETILTALVGKDASQATRDSFRQKLRNGDLDEREIEIEVTQSNSGGPMMDIPGMPGGQIGVMNLTDMFGSAFGKPKKEIKTTVETAWDLLLNDAADALIDNDQLTQEAIDAVENNGIVFLDEIDKIAARSEQKGGDVSREGVQRDLLPLIEGTTVSTKHGFVKTDHILFIASGAFHVAKPSDLLPELQGRLPIRVELRSLTKDDFKAILEDTEASLTKQYIALMATEGVDLTFSDDGIDALADIAVDVNSRVENIGARRLQTVMEKLLEDVSFHAPDRGGSAIEIDRAFVVDVLSELAGNTDLSRFIL